MKKAILLSLTSAVCLLAIFLPLTLRLQSQAAPVKETKAAQSYQNQASLEYASGTVIQSNTAEAVIMQNPFAKLAKDDACFFLLDDETGAVLTGAVFQLTGTDSKTHVLKSNALGKFSLQSLPRQQYRITQIKVPVGYEKSSAQTIDLTKRAPAQLLLYNTRKPRTLIITKYDAADQKKLAGAEFTIYDQKHTKQAVLTTNETGQAAVSALLPGAYYAVETKAPAGYARYTEKLPFSIKEE